MLVGVRSRRNNPIRKLIDPKTRRQCFVDFHDRAGSPSREMRGTERTCVKSSLQQFIARDNSLTAGARTEQRGG